MLNQKAGGWKERKDPASSRKIVLNTERSAFESICTKGKVRLRLFCEEGCSAMVSLESTDRRMAEEDRGEPGVLSLTLSLKELLRCIDRNVVIVFYNRDEHEAAHFHIAAVSQDFWLGCYRPMSEHIQ